jgi:hypothetical protein
MLIVRVGQVNTRDEMLVIRHKAAEYRLVHQFFGALELRQSNFWAIFEQIVNLFVMNAICPTRIEQTRHRQLDQQISQGKRIENASIV